MALRSTSPRKVVPLATGDEVRPRPEPLGGPTTTKRVFFCGVVVEGSESGKRLPEEIQDLVLSLGDLLEANDLTPAAGPAPEDTAGVPRPRTLTNTSALQSVVNELVSTERTYVQRLKILKTDYADPLRRYAQRKETIIIPAYEAKTMFGNIDSLLPVNEAFLADLESMIAPNGSQTVGGVGDVCLEHFKNRRGFEQYKQYYVKREEAQNILERLTARSSSNFAQYIDRTKYRSTDSRNRVGLRELLMDPVQRIPRYTLLFRLMIKHMAVDDPQRAKLLEADEIASKIALAEADEQTKRATIFFCLSSSIQEFPPDLFSNSRCFIDCIDVEDFISDGPSHSSQNIVPTTLHCSLILFDDKLLIIKRPGNGEKGCRALSGLDNLEKSGKMAVGSGRRKATMTFKGTLDLADVVATDIGGADFHLFLENPPQDQSDRWSYRPFRSFTAVRTGGNVDPTGPGSDKQRFLQNLWNAQAKYRTRAGQSVALCSDEVEVESKHGRTTLARTYYNVYQRTAFLQEAKKTKIVVQIDALGSADNIPFGVGGPPFAVIRIQPLAGGLCRYKVTSTDPDDLGEEDIVQTTRVPFRIILTIHQYGLFEFKTNTNSRPSTPTARSHRSILNLDAIYRFPAVDFFAGSINSKRTKSTASRSSSRTHTTHDDSLARFSYRSASTMATTVSSSGMDDDPFLASPKRGTKRPISPGPATTPPDRPLSRSGRTMSRPPSRSSTRSPSVSRADSDDEDEDDRDDEEGFKASLRFMDASEKDLAQRLRLARKNSKSQYERQMLDLPTPSESVIPEEGSMHRPESRASSSRDSTSQCTVTPLTEERTMRARSLSRHSSDRRPMGPRTPSPLPPMRPNSPLPPQRARSPLPPQSHSRAGSQATDSESEDAKARPTGIPRSKRQTFYGTGTGSGNNPGTGASSWNTGAPETPRPLSMHATGGSIVEPLSIKKKMKGHGMASSMSSVVQSPVQNGSGHVRAQSDLPERPHSDMPARAASETSVGQRGQGSTILSRPSPARKAVTVPVETTLSRAPSDTNDASGVEHLMSVAKTTRVDLNSAHRATKKLKVELENMKVTAGGPLSRPGSPTKALRTLSRPGSPVKGSTTPSQPTKMRMERMEEMERLLKSTSKDPATPVGKARKIFDTPSQQTPTSNLFRSYSTDGLETDFEPLIQQVATIDETLATGIQHFETLEEGLSSIQSAGLAAANRYRLEAESSKRQCTLLRALLDDSNFEKDILYDSFNEELDNLFKDINLPDDEAWTAMSGDLKRTKEARHELAKQNQSLKQQLAGAKIQNAQYEALLRSHGLIS